MDSIREFNEESTEAIDKSSAQDINPGFDPATGNLAIEVSTDSEFNPVMRAYYDGRSRVMTRTSLQDGSHTFQTTFEGTRPGKVLYLRSNYGHQFASGAVN